MIQLSSTTEAVFLELIKQSNKWNGAPKIDQDSDQRAAFLDLEFLGLIELFPNAIEFTDLGMDQAKSMGHDPIVEDGLCCGFLPVEHPIDKSIHGEVVEW